VPEPALTWVIGGSGLIGSAIRAAAPDPFAAQRVPWADPDASVLALGGELDRFVRAADGRPWSIAWAAGAATVSSDDAETEREAAVFRRFAELVAAARLGPRGAFFLTSSAGGVHAGSVHPPFDERTPSAPISPYGRARLAQEQAATELLADRLPVVIGRLSNVYGPGQNIHKLQGLISRLAVCSIMREPLNLFVPLSTVRDYVYVTDVAAAVHGWLDHAAGGGTGAHVRIIASGTGTSAGQLVRMAQDIGHRRVPIAMGSHPSAGRQAADLRFVPSVIPGAPPLPQTPLPVGMKSVFDDIHRRMQAAIA
jgi:UDP-glucose 4-epimerase